MNILFCDRWNTPDCWVPQRKEVNYTAPATSRTPSEEFFEYVLNEFDKVIEYHICILFLETKCCRLALAWSIQA